MEESTEPVPLRICTSCGSFQEQEGHFCEKCGAPLTQHAHSDYILGIQARGFALHKATHDPRKLIVVLGTWFWLGPLFALFLFIFVIGLAAVLQDLGSGGLTLFALAVVAFGAAGIGLFGTILYRTSTAWLEQRSGARRTSVDESNDEDCEVDDHLDCLDCGKPFAARLLSCPACGWSYRVERPGDEKAKGE